MEAIDGRLFYAARTNNVRLMELSLRAHENAHEIVDAEGCNILHVAVWHNAEDVVQLLLDAEMFDLSVTTLDGLSLLDIALLVPEPSPQIIRLLLLSDRECNLIKQTEFWYGLDLQITETIVETLTEMGLEFDADNYNLFRKFLRNVFLTTEDTDHIAQSAQLYHRVVFQTFDTWAADFPQTIREILTNVRLDNALFMNGY